MSLRFHTLLVALCTSASAGFAAETPLSRQLQSRTHTGTAPISKESWLPSRTAIIVCDLWDLHHCKNAVTREGEKARRRPA